MMCFFPGAVEEIMCLNNQIIICMLTSGLRDCHSVYITNQMLNSWGNVASEPTLGISHVN